MNIKKLATSQVATLTPRDTVVDAARLMREKHVGSVIVVDAEERPIGILTDRDIVVGVVAQAASDLARLTLADVCTTAPLTTTEDEDFDVVLARMRRHGVRRMPVVDADGRLRGIFALDDALGAIAEELGNVAALLRAERVREDVRRGYPASTS